MKKTVWIVVLIAALGAFTLAGGLARAADEVAAVDDAAAQGFRATDLPLPRFVSLRSDKVYVRAGPALRYPIKWIYRRAGMPVEIVQEFENWRKVKDFEGGEGWVHQSLLSGSRTVMVRAEGDVPADALPLRQSGDAAARLVARVEPRVVASVDKCFADWCRIEAGGYRGWIERNLLWGIYADEELN